MMPMFNVANGVAVAFIIVICVVVMGGVALFIIDVSQSSDAIRRNYPLVGRFRGLFTHLGEFFRQYFFAMDREELPFNRAERDWVKRAAKNKGNTVAFGSTKNLMLQGAAIFVNAPFPANDSARAPSQPRLIGPYARTPYLAPSFFNISGMSYGALSSPAIEALSKGAARAGIWMNTGEGALAPEHLSGNCDIVFQIGTAKYGVRTDDGGLDDDKLRALAARPQVKMFEIKLAQGAKPGKGGILPAEKVNEKIAEVRGIAVGEASYSPNRHPEVGNVQELLDFIGQVREVSGKPVGIKIVVGGTEWLNDLFDEVAQRGETSAPDFITVDGGDGGTGAAPMPLIDNVGLTAREALPLVATLLQQYCLRERVALIASGKLTNPSEVAWALAAGADFVVSGRGFMFSMGCIQALKCNKNTCPTGITTHNPRLQKGLDPNDKSVKVANYALNVIHEVEIIAHSCGVEQPRELDRCHVRIVGDYGCSKPMSQLHPWPE